MRTLTYLAFILFIFSDKIHAQAPFSKGFEFLNVKFGSSRYEAREKLFFTLGATGSLSREVGTNNYRLMYDSVSINKINCQLTFDFYNDSLFSIDVQFPRTSPKELFSLIETFKQLNKNFQASFVNNIQETIRNDSYSFLINNANNCDSIYGEKLFEMPSNLYILKSKTNFFTEAKIGIEAISTYSPTNTLIKCELSISLYAINLSIFEQLLPHTKSNIKSYRKED